VAGADAIVAFQKRLEERLAEVNEHLSEL